MFESHDKAFRALRFQIWMKGKEVSDGLIKQIGKSFLRFFRILL
jgi:hypothetical protein